MTIGRLDEDHHRLARPDEGRHRRQGREATKQTATAAVVTARSRHGIERRLSNRRHGDRVMIGHRK